LTLYSPQNANAVELCFDTALAEAEGLDRHFAEHHTTIGPLHGLAVSIKDQFHVPGYDTAMAYVGWIGTQGGEGEPGGAKPLESELVRELRSLGAIIIAKVGLSLVIWD
jgi:amidase